MNVQILPRFSLPTLPSPKYLLDAGRAGLWEEGLGALVFSHLSEAQGLLIPPQQPEVPTLPHRGPNELPASPLLGSFHLRWPRNAGWGQLSSLLLSGDTANLPVTQAGSLITVTQLASWPKALAGAVPLTPWTFSGHALSLFLSFCIPVFVSNCVPVSLFLCVCVSINLSPSVCFSLSL